jgi:hypothetical protein
MRTFYTSRSRVLDYQACPRLGYLTHAAGGHGYILKRQAIPLATGGATHVGLAEILSGATPSAGALIARDYYIEQCTQRELDVKQLQDASFVYAEQVALAEAMVYMAGLRVIPELLNQYEVVEVETPSQAKLVGDVEWQVVWRSCPDALLRSKVDGQYYLLSWKTAASVGRINEDSARTDMQGLSEAWCLEAERDYSVSVRGIQYVYLVKGQHQEATKEFSLSQGLMTDDEWQAGRRIDQTQSHLIYGYQDQSFPPQLGWTKKWQCSAPHPMRKSRWYPTGECPGDGRNHLRGDDWTQAAMWTAGGVQGVRGWIDQLASGQVQAEAGDPFREAYQIPMVQWRTLDAKQNWLEQQQAQQARRAKDLITLEEIAANEAELGLDFNVALNARFPQHTATCPRLFGRRCPMWAHCWEDISLDNEDVFIPNPGNPHYAGMEED